MTPLKTPSERSERAAAEEKRMLKKIEVISLDFFLLDHLEQPYKNSLQADWKYQFACQFDLEHSHQIPTFCSAGKSLMLVVVMSLSEVFKIKWLSIMHHRTQPTKGAKIMDWFNSDWFLVLSGVPWFRIFDFRIEILKPSLSLISLRHQLCYLNNRFTFLSECSFDEPWFGMDMVRPTYPWVHFGT